MTSPSSSPQTPISTSTIPASQQANNAQPSRWIKLCHLLFPILLGFWTVIILGLIINIGSAWLTSKSMDMTGTPLGWLLDHWFLVGILTILLLALTLTTA